MQTKANALRWEWNEKFLFTGFLLKGNNLIIKKIKRARRYISNFVQTTININILQIITTEPVREKQGSFALCLAIRSWIVSPPNENNQKEIVWQAMGVHGVPIKARRDGYIIFEFEKSPQYIIDEIPLKFNYSPNSPETKRREVGDKRFKYMNAFLESFYSGYKILQHQSMSVQVPLSPINYYTLRDGEPVKYHDKNPPVDPNRQDIIEARTLDYCIKLMESCHKVFGDDFLEILSLPYIASYQLTSHQFSAALIISWVVVEKIINKVWSLHQDELHNSGKAKMTGKRRDLLSGRDYSASVVSQILSITGKIDDAMLERLDNARKTRNNFVHGLTPINSKDAVDCIKISADLISSITREQYSTQTMLIGGL